MGERVDCARGEAVMDKCEPIHIPVPLWLPEEALEHYRELVLAIGAMWVSGEWWLPFYLSTGSSVDLPLNFWLSLRREAAQRLNSLKEISTMAEEQKSGPVNLDDTQVIEKGPEVKASEAAIEDTFPDGKGVAELEAAAGKADLEQVKALAVEDLDKDRLRKESMAAAAAAGINTPCEGSGPDPEMEVVDGVADAKPPAPLGHDHAEGRPQKGIAADPDPIAVGCGLRASQIAKIAYDAVQGYKETIGQKPTWFCYLLPEVKGRITFQVAEILRGRCAGAAKVHQMWRVDQLNAGITVEQDPRLGQAWLEMDPSESRKGLIFQMVVNSLIRKF